MNMGVMRSPMLLGRNHPANTSRYQKERREQDFKFLLHCLGCLLNEEARYEGLLRSEPEIGSLNYYLLENIARPMAATKKSFTGLSCRDLLPSLS